MRLDVARALGEQLCREERSRCSLEACQDADADVLELSPAEVAWRLHGLVPERLGPSLACQYDRAVRVSYAEAWRRSLDR